MAGHPGAERAAEQFIGKATRLLLKASDGPISPENIFGSVTSKKQPRYRQTGDISLRDVRAMILRGNLRERMNALGNAQLPLFQLLEDLAQEAEFDPAFAARLEQQFGLDVDLLIRRLVAMEQSGARHLFVAAADGAVSQQPDMREVRPAPPEVAKAGIISAHRRPTTNLTPKLSPRELEHAWEGAQQAFQRQLLSPMKDMPRPEQPDKSTFLLPHKDGTTLMRAVAEHPWHIESLKANMPTRVSISGSAYRLSAMQRVIDPNPARSQDFVMALIGHLVPHHHTYHEVMAAVAELGETYDPTPGGMLAHARRLIAEHPTPIGAHQSDNLEALRRAADEVERALAQREEQATPK